MSDDDGKSSRDGIKDEEAPPELEVLVEAEAIFEGQLAPTVWEKTEENPTYDIHKKRFKNNFDIIRTFAAILVVYSHTYAVGKHTDWFGNENDPLLNFHFYLAKSVTQIAEGHAHMKNSISKDILPFTVHPYYE